MSKPTNYFNGNECLFCDKPAVERMHSGSYQTYFTCDCEGRKRYEKAQAEMRGSLITAKKNERIVELKRKISAAERSLQSWQKDLDYLERTS